MRKCECGENVGIELGNRIHVIESESDRMTERQRQNMNLNSGESTIACFMHNTVCKNRQGNVHISNYNLNVKWTVKLFI
jgi:hypothetical protein